MKTAIVPIHVRGNIALDEPPGRPRLVAGPPMSGQVYSSQTYDLTLLVPDADDVHTVSMAFEPVEVEFLYRTWPMWRLRGGSLDAFVHDALLTLIEANLSELERAGVVCVNRELPLDTE